MAIRIDPDDDRRTCAQCAQIGRYGPCQAVRKGELVASRNYEPNRELLRRCEAYVPRPDDPDQRPGRERWPGLDPVKPMKQQTKKGGR